MIRAEEIDAVPAAVLSSLSSIADADWRSGGWARAVQLAKVDRMWALRDGETFIAVVGVYQTSALSNRNELFLLFTQDFVRGFRRYLRGLATGLRVVKGLYPNLIVKATCGTNSKFARLFGAEFLHREGAYDVLRV